MVVTQSVTPPCRRKCGSSVDFPETLEADELIVDHVSAVTQTNAVWTGSRSLQAIPVTRRLRATVGELCQRTGRDGTKREGMFDLSSGTHLQRQTGGRVQRFESPAALPVELQQVGVVLPAEWRGRGGGEEEDRTRASGCGS